MRFFFQAGALSGPDVHFLNPSRRSLVSNLSGWPLLEAPGRAAYWKGSDFQGFPVLTSFPGVSRVFPGKYRCPRNSRESRENTGFQGFYQSPPSGLLSSALSQIHG